jgi:hypothetical protein
MKGLGKELSRFRDLWKRQSDDTCDRSVFVVDLTSYLGRRQLVDIGSSGIDLLGAELA